jgi:hypothetical protein
MELTRTGRRGRRMRWLLGGLVGAVCVGTATRYAAASDHQDTPEVELNATMDINDVFAFPGSAPGRIVLAMTTASPIAPGTPISFNPNLLYQFKIDNSGDAVEDRVIQVTFTGTGASQQVHVRGPVAPAQVGTMNTVATAGAEIIGPVNSAMGGTDGIQVFAGLRDDPFWIDLEQFFRILPDRKPVGGQLSTLPETPSASAWRNPGVDFLRGLNCLAIVIELPVSQLTAGGNAKIGVWGTISR